MAELPRPGVEVIQVFRATSPTVITPTLVPNITGVAKQIVSLNVDDGAGGSLLNTEAFVQLTGGFIAKAGTGTPAVYGGLDGLALVLSILNGPNVTVTFSDSGGTGLTPAGVVAQVRAAFTAAGVTAAYPALIGDGSTQWGLFTVGVGEFQKVFVSPTTTAAVASAFGIGLGKTYAGTAGYEQTSLEIPQTSFPDPRGNLNELGIEQDSIRVFLSLGSGQGVKEASREEAFLRRGTIDSAASVTGNVDLGTLTLPGDLAGLTVIISVAGATAQTCTFGTPANEAAVLSEIESAIDGVVATQDGSGQLVITSEDVGSGASLAVSGSALATLGVAAATYTGSNIAAIDDGDGDSLTTLLDFDGIDFTATPTAAVIAGSSAMVGSAAGLTLEMTDGTRTQTLEFSASAVDATTAIAEINAVWGTSAGGQLTATAPGGIITLTHSKAGTDSVIRILGGTALTTLDPGGTPTLAVGTYRGAPSLPAPGDQLWVDGLYYADILEVAPGGVDSVLKISARVVVDADIGSDFYIVARNLPGSGTRPAPELQITGAGAALIKQELLRDTAGNVVDTAAPLFLTYSAVRKDVTAIAENPGLLVFDDTTQLEQALSPVSAANPLALGLFFALVNGAGVQITGLGVDEVSADSPFGTVEAFARAAEFLEGREVYATTPLTHDTSVHQIWKAHAEAMSEAEAKGERVAIVNQPYPTHYVDTLVASGTNGNSTGAGGADFKTGVANLTALVLNAGVSPTGTIPASSGLMLDIASNSLSYSIASISGTTITVRTTFGPGENDDGFYATTALPTNLIQEAFTVKVRGKPLLTPAGTPDNDGVAQTVAAIGQTYGSRRLWMVTPDRCAATIGGIETVLEGFYLTAGICGLIGAQPPQQSFTNFPMVGYTQVIGSQDRFSDRQLNTMAGGGAYIIVQDARSAPLTARMALTTNLTSIETRTDSITKVVDFTAKLLRRSLRNFIGRFNISQGFLDSLSSVIDGVGGFLIENSVLNGFNLNNLIQDESQPDTVIIDVTLDVPYPCNYIRLVLSI